jgi:hypothetical protein
VSVIDDLKKLEASIIKRYQELQPAIAELEELRRAAERLGIDLEAPQPARNGRSSSQPLATARPRRPAGKTAGRRRRSQRREQVLALVTERPGITVPEIAKELKVDPTGLYRVVRQLEADGGVRKRDKQLHPVS